MTGEDKVLTAMVGKNEEVFPTILRLYGFNGMKVADVTYGAGNFWRRVDASRYELLATDLTTGTDCRHLPYDDGALDMVVLDPPYVYNPKRTVKASIADSYNVNGDGCQLRNAREVLGFYADAMTEAARVLVDGGILVVKCQDTGQDGRQKWMHVDIYQAALERGFAAEDLFVVVQPTRPTIRWDVQYHARKNHSYFWVFQKGRSGRHAASQGATPQRRNSRG